MIYRGQVVDCNDPEERFRYRVRVHGIHPPDAPTDHLPWAELVTPFSAKLAGDFAHYEVGDLVFVVFEHNDAHKPLIIGGWLSHSGGINDVDDEQRYDYARSRRRWVRVDRAGNRIELSEVDDETWVRLVSGSAEITLSQNQGTIRIRSKSGPVSIEGANFDLNADTAAIQGRSVDVRAEGVNSSNQERGVLALTANYRVRLCGKSRSDIAVYLPTINGVPAGTPVQSDVSSILAKDITVGAVGGDTYLGAPVVPTVTVRMRGLTVSLTATAGLNLSSTGPLSISSNTSVNITAPSISMGPPGP